MWSRDKYDIQRDTRLTFSLQFTQSKQEVPISLPALKA